MMFSSTNSRRLLLLLASLLSIISVARAEFAAIETFDTLTLGNIDDQNGWYSAGTTNVVSPDPIGGQNQVLAVTTDSNFAFREPGFSVSESGIRTMFWRFRFDNQFSCSFGLSYASFPSQFGDFSVELGISNATRELRVNDGGQYKVVAILQPDTWYNVWAHVDNPNDTFALWINDSPFAIATSADRLSYTNMDGSVVEEFSFRVGGPRALESFFVKNGGGNSANSGPVFIDDIYLEDSDALDLGNPVVPIDSDGDSVVDLLDNCTETANADQADTDADGFGNGCDADFNNDCAVNFSDLAFMKSVFFCDDATQACLNADLDGDGVVSFLDLAILRQLFFLPPGPSGLPTVCDGAPN